MRKIVFVSMCVVLVLAFALTGHAMVNASDAIGTAVTRGDSNRSSQETAAGNNLAQGGNTTMINLTTTVLSDKWQGYYGKVNGSLILGAGESVFYNFGSLKANVVLASLDQNFNFAEIRNATGFSAAYNPENISSILDLVFFNTTGDDPRVHADSANRTYTLKNKIGSVLGVTSTTLNPTASGFHSGILQNGTLNESSPSETLANARKKFAFGVNVTLGAADFLGDGHTSDYELMVPVATVGATYGSATYYFFMDIE